MLSLKVIKLVNVPLQHSKSFSESLQVFRDCQYDLIIRFLDYSLRPFFCMFSRSTCRMILLFSRRAISYVLERSCKHGLDTRITKLYF